MAYFHVVLVKDGVEIGSGKYFFIRLRKVVATLARSFLLYGG